MPSVNYGLSTVLALKPVNTRWLIERIVNNNILALGALNKQSLNALTIIQIKRI